MYPYAESMAIEGAKPETFWHVIKTSNFFAERGTLNTIVMCNFLQEYRLIVFNPNTSRQFRLDVTNREKLLALNDA